MALSSCLRSQGVLLAVGNLLLSALDLDSLLRWAGHFMADKTEAGKIAEPLPLDDRKLIEGCLRGDSKAWEALILRYQRLIYSIPLRNGFSPVDAADVFQAVCLKLLERLPTVRDYEKLSSWIMTTTRRECWRVAAERRREGQTPLYDDDYEKDILARLEATEPLADQQRILYERQQAVREALAQLSERCRRLLTLLFYNKEDMSYAEIARQIGAPVNSIGPTRARCLEKLKKILEGKL
jgi:RNA polymerase sigma factor (sigma-70 family)